MTERRLTPIEVLEVRRLEGDGNLKAFAKVRLGAVVIHGCRIIQQPGQKVWVALPQQPARHKADGTGTGWFPVIEITNPDLLARVRAAVLDAWERHEQVPRPDRGIRRPVRGTSTRERAGSAVEPFYDDSAEAICDLVEGPGR